MNHPTYAQFARQKKKCSQNSRHASTSSSSSFPYFVISSSIFFQSSRIPFKEVTAPTIVPAISLLTNSFKGISFPSTTSFNPGRPGDDPQQPGDRAQRAQQLPGCLPVLP